MGQRSPQKTVIGGSGGNYESVAIDKRDPFQPKIFLTEDSEYGALRKFTPQRSQNPNWDTLHGSGTTEYLEFTSGSRFKWTTNLQAARNSQATYYPNVEGIDFRDGKLYFVSKKTSKLYVLNLEAGKYTATSTKESALLGQGEFRNQPDQIVRNNDGDYLYLTEDGGSSPGVYSRHIPTGERYAIFEAYDTKYVNDETTGLAFSPDGSKMYACFQDCGCDDSDGGADYTCGCLLEFSRQDGRSFDGSTLSLKYHSSASV